ASETLRPRRSLFIRLVSHSPTVCDLARTAHPRSANLDVSPDLYPDPGGSERVGNALGKRDQHPSQQAGLAEKTDARLGVNANPIRELSRSLESHFQHRERQSLSKKTSAKGAAAISSLGAPPQDFNVLKRQR